RLQVDRNDSSVAVFSDLVDVPEDIDAPKVHFKPKLHRVSAVTYGPDPPLVRAGLGVGDVGLDLVGSAFTATSDVGFGFSSTSGEPLLWLRHPLPLFGNAPIVVLVV